jgi:hypothetical protein
MSVPGDPIFEVFVEGYIVQCFDRGGEREWRCNCEGFRKGLRCTHLLLGSSELRRPDEEPKKG